MREWTRRLFALALFSGLSACGGSDEITMNLPQNTVQEAQTDSHITILAKAVGAVDVQESLFGTPVCGGCTHGRGLCRAAD